MSIGHSTFSVTEIAVGHHLSVGGMHVEDKNRHVFIWNARVCQALFVGALERSTFGFVQLPWHEICHWGWSSCFSSKPRFKWESGYFREGVQYDIQSVWPLLAGVRPNDPNVAPPFDPREVLENENGEVVLDDSIPMFPSPVHPEPAGAAPAASSAGAEPSAGAPADPMSEYMDVDLRGDKDDEGMEIGLIEDHCIHYHHSL